MTCVTLLLVYIFSVLNTFWVRKKRNTLKPQFFFHPHFPSLKHEKGNRNDVPLLFPCILVQNFIPQIKTRFHIYRALTLRSKTFWRSKFATPIMFLVFQSCPNPTFLLIFERSSCLTKESSNSTLCLNGCNCIKYKERRNWTHCQYFPHLSQKSTYLQISHAVIPKLNRVDLINDCSYLPRHLCRNKQEAVGWCDNYTLRYSWLNSQI